MKLKNEHISDNFLELFYYYYSNLLICHYVGEH